MSAKSSKWSLRQKCLAGFMGICMIALGTYWVHDLKEPRYKGQKNSTWFDSFTSSRAARQATLKANVVFTNGVFVVLNSQVDKKRRRQLHEEESNAKKALLEMGTNAVPFYLAVLNQRENAFDRWYQKNYASKLNFAARILPQPRLVQMRQDAVLELATEAGISSPELRVAMIDFFLTVRTNVPAYTLAGYFRKPPFEHADVLTALDQYLKQQRFGELLELIPLSFSTEKLRTYLVAAFERPELPIKFRALCLLEQSDYDLRPIEPKLRETLRHSDKEMRYYSARALEKIKPMSQETKEAFEAALGDSNEMVGNVARRALGAVAGKGESSSAGK